ncbi:hypothetical protein [Demequina sp.]|uniref:hypothetical protein n=1 Tax=Demequina sp. TaxID=2050685 RepID=UPI003D1439AE
MSPERPGISPADDPYEFDWPDDAKEERAALREAEAKKTHVNPAPLLLSAAVIGTGTVLMFVLPVSILAGSLTFFIAMTAPIVLGGLVVALLPAVLLQRASAGWRRGLPEVAFLALGFTIGMAWTWVVMTYFNAPQPDVVRTSVFMGTAVAAAFFAARGWAENFRHMPRYVYTAAGVIGLLVVASIINYILFAIG